MGDRDHYTPGTFCWAEVGTVDPEASATFYTGLFGWDAVDMALAGGGDATTFQLFGRDACAAAPRPQAGTSGLAVLRLRRERRGGGERAQGAGATVVREPLNVYAAARTAILRDPTARSSACGSPGPGFGATLVNDPGAMCLNQLDASDPDRATAFYAEVFGWRVEPAGTDDQPYWGIFNGPGLNGGMMLLPLESGAPSHWLVYFATVDIDATAGRISELGGRVLVPPTDVPNGRISVAQDPQGATFGLYAGNLDP